jgi:hypothetical protein
MMQHLSEQEAWDQIRQSVFRIAGEIRFGKVEITIHEGDIVQVEVTEKFRQPPERNANRSAQRSTLGDATHDQNTRESPAGKPARRDPDSSADRTTGSTSYSGKRSSSK